MKKEKDEKHIFIDVSKFLLDYLLQIVVKPGIYVICCKYEFLCSCF